MVCPGLDDRGVLALARHEGRVLLTFDADFGELIYLQGAPPPTAVVHFRLHPIVVSEVASRALAALQAPLDGLYIVITNEGMRRRSLARAGAPD